MQLLIRMAKNKENKDDEVSINISKNKIDDNVLLQTLLSPRYLEALTKQLTPIIASVTKPLEDKINSLLSRIEGTQRAYDELLGYHNQFCIQNSKKNS